MNSEDQSKSTSLISMEDLSGLGAVGTRIIDAVQQALGALWRPVRLKEEADGEGYRIIATARAEAERRKILSAADFDIAERAEQRLLGQEIQRQKNLEEIVKEGLKQSVENDEKVQDRSESDQTINPDWMIRFRNLAQDVSNTDMQTVWGRVLENEAREPGSYSFRALECLSNMRQVDAVLFQKACHLAFEGYRILIVDPSSYFGGLEEFLTFDEILKLKAMEIIHESQSYMTGSPAPKVINLKNNGAIVQFKLTSFEKSELRVSQYLFTPVGQELARLVHPKINIPYLRKLKEYMPSNGYNVQVILPTGDGIGRVIV
jgi:hypothetical protein